MDLLLGILGLIGVMMMALSVLAMALWCGHLAYCFMRGSLYRRPLTAEEQWAETSVEAQTSADAWAEIVSTLNREQP